MEQHNFEQNYPHIKIYHHRFEQVIKDNADNRGLSHIYICGPTPFTHSLMQELEQLMVSPKKYTIL